MENVTEAAAALITDVPSTFTTTDTSTNTTRTTTTVPTVGQSVRSQSGRCLEMPSGINVNILYAEAGLTGYRPIYMIVGARIT